MSSCLVIGTIIGILALLLAANQKKHEEITKILLAGILSCLVGISVGLMILLNKMIEILPLLGAKG